MKAFIFATLLATSAVAQANVIKFESKSQQFSQDDITSFIDGQVGYAKRMIAEQCGPDGAVMNLEFTVKIIGNYVALPRVSINGFGDCIQLPPRKQNKEIK